MDSNVGKAQQEDSGGVIEYTNGLKVVVDPGKPLSSDIHFSPLPGESESGVKVSTVMPIEVGITGVKVSTVMPIEVDDTEKTPRDLESSNNKDNTVTEKEGATQIGRMYAEYEKHIFIFCVSFIILSGIGLVIATILRSDVEQNNELRFWMNQLAKYLLIMIFQLIAGVAVERYKVMVNYSRKFVHVCYFLFPLILDKYLLGFKQDVISALWTVWVVIFLLLLMAEMFVNRFPLFRILYAAIDRPEDRPFTRLWFITQLIFSIIIIAFYSYVFSVVIESDESGREHPDRSNWVFIIVLVVALGDGLAEPVGVRFGKHKYTTRAMCTHDKYTRSIEGSACVAIMTVIAVSAYFNDFRTAEYVSMVVILPVVMTLTEAVAPHTWDNPILFFVGYTTMLVIYLIVDNV